MSETTGAAVVIIGGGVTGLSAGWWLARAGVDVLVLERGIVGWGGSRRNGGGATQSYERGRQDCLLREHFAGYDRARRLRVACG